MKRARNRSVASSLRPSPAFVLAALALAFSLGGTAYAVSQIDGKNLVDRSVPGSKLKVGAVTGTELKESSVGRVPSAAYAASVDVRTKRATVPLKPSSDTATGGIAHVVAPCPSGYRAVGGGYAASRAAHVPYAQLQTTRYAVIAINQESKAGELEADVSCIRFPPGAKRDRAPAADDVAAIARRFRSQVRGR